MEDFSSYFLILLSGSALLLFLFLRKHYNYWSNQGIYQFQPLWILGNLKPVIFDRKPLGQMILEWHNEIKQKGLKFGGLYHFTRPVLIPVDLEIIKRILTVDFSSFSGHGAYVDEQHDPLTGHLFGLDGEKWKNMRVRLTPTFTSGKMKSMFNIIQSCTTGLKEMLEQYEKSGEAIDIKDILGRFTTDVIGTCAFGIECNSIKDPNTPFRIFGKKVFEQGAAQFVKTTVLSLLPKSLARATGIKLFPNDVQNFFVKVMEDTVNYRESNNIVRKDFVHLLLQIKNKGKVSDEDDFKGMKGEAPKMTMNELTAQAFIFFLAGFETSSTTMTFALYELAVNQHIQDKVRKEINDTLAKYNGEVTYDAVAEMKYLDRVLNETLRIHSPASALQRECNKDYIIPGTTKSIKKGTIINISILGLHMDSEYYPDPEKFDPDRFTEENKAKRPAYTFLPFGEGPRICIGLRFGILQSKIGLIALVRNYKITLNAKTKVPLEMDPDTAVNSAKGGVWINVESL